MKTFALLCFLVVVPASAQNSETGRMYGAVVSKVGMVRDTKALFVGGRGGWIIDDAFAIGIEGYMLVNNIDARVPDTSGNHFLTMDYGGIDLEYITPIGGHYYLTFQTLIGGGAIGHQEVPYLDRRQYHDPFIVVEPGVSVEIAATSIFRIGIGASYRQIALLKSNLATQNELSGPSGFLSLKVGFF